MGDEGDWQKMLALEQGLILVKNDDLRYTLIAREEYFEHEPSSSPIGKMDKAIV